MDSLICSFKEQCYMWHWGKPPSTTGWMLPWFPRSNQVGSPAGSEEAKYPCVFTLNQV